MLVEIDRGRSRRREELRDERREERIGRDAHRAARRVVAVGHRADVAEVLLRPHAAEADIADVVRDAPVLLRRHVGARDHHLQRQSRQSARLERTVREQVLLRERADEGAVLEEEQQVVVGEHPLVDLHLRHAPEEIAELVFGETVDEDGIDARRRQLERQRFRIRRVVHELDEIAARVEHRERQVRVRVARAALVAVEEDLDELAGLAVEREGRVAAVRHAALALCDDADDLRRRRIVRLVPLEHDEAARIELDRLRDIASVPRVEVVEAAGVERRVHGAEVEVGAAPGRGPARHDVDVRVVGLARRAVAGRGEVRHAARGDVVHGLRDHAVLEHRLGRVDHVVHDDVGLEAGRRVAAHRRSRRARGCCSRS